MAPITRKVQWLVWGGLLLVIATVGALFLVAQVRARQAHATPLPIIGTVSNFALTNQSGTPVTLADLRGQVWVADIIFTRCPGPCLKMTRQMNDLQGSLPRGSQARLVTLTTDPDFDTPTAFRDYLERLKINAPPNRWLFLTGSKSEIAKLAVDSLKLTAIEKQPAERESINDLFIHSTIFVVVDKQSRLRGVFETTGEGVDFKQIKPQILEAIHRLEGES
jgi:protein SCO1/2